jgi:23S rRNA pseudouridine2605 synthase
VEVNGKKVEDFRYPVNVETDRVTVSGKAVSLRPEKLVYLLVNKPRGIISTTSDERGRQAVLEILPQKLRKLRLYPVGRLDLDSTGLLLLTNDGDLTYRLTHPRFEHEKEYLVQIEGSLNPGQKKKLEEGLELEDGMTYPAVVGEVKSSPPFNYSLTIHEGRKHQVRRMFQSLGFQVHALKRVRMGNLTLGNLKEGEARELTAKEISELRASR